VTLQRGHFVTITQGDETLDAMVGFASPNGRSVMLLFDGFLRDGRGGGFVGAAPALQQEDGTWILLTGTPIQLARTSPEE
jgi:hypothetical protein